MNAISPVDVLPGRMRTIAGTLEDAMTADREQVVVSLTCAFRDTDYDRLLTAALQESASC